MVSIGSLLADNQPQNERFYTVAIDGRGASGKSRLAEHLSAILPGFTFIAGDGYFEPLANNLAWGAFNERRFHDDVLAPLRVGASFRYRPYDWDTAQYSADENITVARGFCLDRCFSFALDYAWDIRIWVETPRALCLERGISRDTGMGEARARATWETVWQPAEDRYLTEKRPAESATVPSTTTVADSARSR